MEFSQDKIESAIIEQAVEQLVQGDDLYDRVRKGVEARIDKLFAEHVQAVIAQAVEEMVKDGFDRQYSRYDGFGRPVGEPTSISKELERLVSGYWTERVDRQGKVARDSYNSTSRAEWMMMQICAEDFSKELKAHTVNVAGALKDHFRGVLNDHVGQLLSEVFKVKSLGDQADEKARKESASAFGLPPAKPVGAP